MRRPVLRSALFALVLSLAACGGDAGSEGSLTDPTETDEQAEEPGSPATDEEPEPETEGEPDDEVTADEPADEPAAAPTPDAAAVADPCADDQGREGEAFIDVDAPVADQEISDPAAVQLVGCSNVNEANVQWELYDGDGALLDEGFLTAECGTGCVGAFDEELDLSAADGEPFAELHVFAESAQDGSQEHLTEIPLVLS